MSEWISVEDREPPTGELVLGLDMRDGNLSTSFRVVWYVSGCWFTGFLATPIDPATHWMQLPKLPEPPNDL